MTDCGDSSPLVDSGLLPGIIPHPGQNPANLNLLPGEMGGIEVAAGGRLPGALEGLQMEVVGSAILHVVLNPEGCVPLKRSSGEPRRLRGGQRQAAQSKVRPELLPGRCFFAAAPSSACW